MPDKSALAAIAENLPFQTFHYLIQDNYMNVFVPIMSSGKMVGIVYLQSPLHSMGGGFINLLQVMILIAIMILFIANKLQETITGPLSRLSTTMQELAYSDDFSLRAQQEGNDEVGKLAAGFNAMLTKLQRRDKNRRESQEQIRQLAYYDTLTGLPNRAFSLELINQSIEEAKQNEQMIALMFLDLDKFKDINDNLGHQAGDDLLKQSAKRFQSIIRQGDKIMVSRLGGDEFLILVREFGHIDNLKKIASRLLEKSKKSYLLCGQQVYVGVSIGVAIYPSHGKNVKELIQSADIAMYTSKESGKGQFYIFNEEMSIKAKSKVSLNTEINQALQRDEFEVSYQPKMNLKNREMVSVQAFLSWHHPKRGTLKAIEFETMLDRTDTTLMVNEWFLNEVCQNCEVWQKNRDQPIPISIQLSKFYFLLPNVVDSIQRIISQFPSFKNCLEFGLTEGMIMMNDEQIINKINQFKQLGIKLSLNDFGTGYSSLRHLSRYPLDAIKISPSFISNVVNDQNDALVTDAIINLAHSFNLPVIAEGVETKEQISHLLTRNCDAVQGSVVSQLVTAEQLERLITQSGEDNIND